MAVEPVVLDNDILAFYEAGLADALTKFRSEISVSASGIDERNYRHCLLLRAHRDGPCGRGTAHKSDELAPPHLPASRLRTSIITAQN
jgi:hypothetical protein